MSNARISPPGIKPQGERIAIINLIGEKLKSKGPMLENPSPNSRAVRRNNHGPEMVLLEGCGVNPIVPQGIVFRNDFA